MSDYLIVQNPRFELEQKILVFRVVLRLLDIVAGKALNRAEIFPEGQRNKVSNVSLLPFQNVNTQIPGNTLVVGNRTLTDKLTISLSFAGRNASMPHAGDHGLPPSIQCLARNAKVAFRHSSGYSFHISCVAFARTTRSL